MTCGWLHFVPNEGWKARWSPRKERERLPGIVFMTTDAGIPYTDDDVDQVWAVIAPSPGLASVGTWYYSRDLKNRQSDQHSHEVLGQPSG